MNKTFIVFTLVTALFVSAVTTVLGQSHLASPAFVFPVLSIVVPILLQRTKQFKDDLQLPLKYQWYSWLIVNVFIHFSNALSFFAENQLLILLILFSAYFLVQVLIELLALLLSVFFARERRYGIIDEALDMCVYILPIPFIYLGSILYIDLQHSPFLFVYARAIEMNIVIAEFLLFILAMLVFALYLYPRNGVKKLPRFIRILGTAAIWIAMNAHILYGGYIPDFVKALVPTVIPTYQANPLVYITPSIIEACFIIASVVIGYGLEVGVTKGVAKSKS
ncbi:hypothetical protein [Veillonella agrestimuris]|uniref:hypothetical protein n=1 Tax=Veillonella agrestimuris TaxID=2941340 RepID=UPI00203F3EF7|nr:hypothetical protein [Veillonella agrestimuris]